MSYRRLFSWKAPKPEKPALLVRFGAFGDMLWAASVAAGLKKQGHHVTLMGKEPGIDAVRHDPNIDRIIVLDEGQVPNGELGAYFESLRKKWPRYVNLTETVETALLTVPSRSDHLWPKAVRDLQFNRNYLEFQHLMAGVPHEPAVKFYATPEEKAWARRERARMGEPVILWQLHGSAVHKVWAHVEALVKSLVHYLPYAHVVLAGGPEAVSFYDKAMAALETAEQRARLTCAAGHWSIRQTLAFVEQADLVMGPETGVLNAASHEPMAKIVFLSHSSHENLTRDWVNTIALAPEAGKAPCYPCHKLHYDWTHCHKDAETNTALCQAAITPEQVWAALQKALIPILQARSEAAA